MRMAALALALALAAAFPSGASAQFSGRASVYRNGYGGMNSDELGFAVVTVTNETSRPESAEVQVKCARGEVVFQARAESLQPSETRALAIPTLAEPQWVEVAGAGSRLSIAPSYQSAETRALLISTSRTHPTALQEQALYEAVFWNAPDLLTDPAQGGGGGRGGYSPSYSRTPARLGGKGSSATYGLDMLQAPDDWRCYLVADIVFVAEEVHREIEREPSGRALLQWVQTGGTLAIYSASADSRERLGAGMVVRSKKSPYEEPEAFFGDGGSPGGGGEAGGPSILPAHPRPHGWKDFASSTWNNFNGYGYGYGTSRSQAVGASEFPVQIASQTNYDSPVALSLVFFIVAGPANFFFLRSKKRIKLLFATVPAISLAFCALITAVFFLSAGLDRRASAVSLTIVDQRSGKALTAARQLFYSGVYPNGGFQWDKDVFFLPMQLQDSGSFDLSKGYALSGGQYQPLEEMHYLTVQPFETREKIEARPAKGGEGLELANGFGMDLESAIVRHEGVWYRAGRVRKGDAAVLARMPEPPGGAEDAADPLLMPDHVWRALGADGRTLSLASRLTQKFYFYPDQAPGWHPRQDARQGSGLPGGANEADALMAFAAALAPEGAQTGEGTEEFLGDMRLVVELGKELDAYADGGAALPKDFGKRVEAIKSEKMRDGLREALGQAQSLRESLKPANLYFAVMAERPETAKAGPSRISEVGSTFLLAGVY